MARAFLSHASMTFDSNFDSILALFLGGGGGGGVDFYNNYKSPIKINIKIKSKLL